MYVGTFVTESADIVIMDDHDKSQKVIRAANVISLITLRRFTKNVDAITRGGEVIMVTDQFFSDVDSFYSRYIHVAAATEISPQASPSEVRKLNKIINNARVVEKLIEDSEQWEDMKLYLIKHMDCQFIGNEEMASIFSSVRAIAKLDPIEMPEGMEGEI